MNLVSNGEAPRHSYSPINWKIQGLVEEKQREIVEKWEFLIGATTIRLMELGYAPGSVRIAVDPANFKVASFDNQDVLIDMRWEEVIADLEAAGQDFHLVYDRAMNDLQVRHAAKE